MTDSMAPLSVQFNCSLSAGQIFTAYPLSQPYRHPIQIEEIIFSFSVGPTVTEGNKDDWRALLHQLGFGMKVGAAAVVLDRTAPLPAFCRRLGLTDGYALNNVVGSFQRANGANFSGLPMRSHLSWKLPAPIFVPEKAQLECEVSFAADIPNPNDSKALGQVQVWVSLIGKALPKLEPWPKVVRVPWISSFKTTPAAISAGDVNGATPENGLQNSNNEPVVVQRMLGCAVTQKASDEIIDVEVRVSDTTGAYIVRELTPMLELFNGRTRCWDMGAVLKPKEFIVVEYRYGVASIVGNATPTITYQTSDEIQLIFGLVGYRELPFEEVFPQAVDPATGATAAELSALKRVPKNKLEMRPTKDPLPR